MLNDDQKQQLFGALDFASEKDDDGLTRAERFAAALDPLILPQMRMGEQIRATGASRMKKQGTNKTVEWLKSNGYAEIAAMVQTNPAIASNVMSAIIAKKINPPQAKAKGQVVSAEQLRKIYPNEKIPDGLYNIKTDGTITPVSSGGVTNKFGPGFQVKGDYVIMEDPNSPSGVRMVPIPGSETATKQATNLQNEQDVASAENLRNQMIVADLDRAINALSSGSIFDLPEAGILGARLADLGVNQEAVQLKEDLKSLQAKITFDRLGELRKASVNGASGLGAITAPELDLLGASLGSINQIQDPQVLLAKLKEIRPIIAKIQSTPAALAILAGADPQYSGGANPGGTVVGDPY